MFSPPQLFFSFHHHLIKNSSLASPRAPGPTPPCRSLMKISEPFLSGYRIHVFLDLHYFSNVYMQHPGLLLCFLLLGSFIAWPNFRLDNVLSCWTMFILASNQTVFLFWSRREWFQICPIKQSASAPHHWPVPVLCNYKLYNDMLHFKVYLDLEGKLSQ